MPTAMAFEDVTSFLEQILVHSYESESESEVAQSCPSLRDPVDCSLPGSSIHGWFSRQEYWSGLPFPPPADLPSPGIKPRSPALQADSLPAEPQGKPKNTGAGSLSLLQGIFLTQELNRGLLHCKRILYQPSYQGAQLDFLHFLK